MGRFGLEVSSYGMRKGMLMASSPSAEGKEKKKNRE
jgi:hypothetical protein